jgi:lysophospholipase L1-like esterase
MALFLKSIPKNERRIVVIVPPPMKQGEWVQDPDLLEESGRLGATYQEITMNVNVQILDSGNWDIPLAYDGVHFSEEGHKLFADKLYIYFCAKCVNFQLLYR